MPDTETHRHRVESSSIRCYTGPVQTRSGRENPAAHGNITHVEVCRCGAIKKTNSNAGPPEVGIWEGGTPENDGYRNDDGYRHAALNRDDGY